MAIETNIGRMAAVTLFFAIALAGASAMFSEVPVGLPVGALLGLAGFIYAAIRWPELFLVAAMFAPRWKTYWPLSAVAQIADLTVVMLVGLSIGLLWRLFIHVGRLDPRSLQKLFFRQSGPVLTFLLFALVLAASYTYTPAPDYGSIKLTRFLFIASLFFLTAFFLIFTERDFRRFLRVFVVFAMITALQVVAGLTAMVREEGADITRIGAASLLGMAVIVVLFYPLFTSAKSRGFFLLLALPVLTAGLIASAARGPLVALVAVLLIRVLVWVKQGQLRTALALLVLFATSAVAMYSFVPEEYLGKYTVKMRELALLPSGEVDSGSAGQRLRFYRATLGAIPEHPLFGRGIGSWSVFYLGYDQRAYPHNLFLEVAFEQGLLGLSFFVLFLSAVAVSLLWLQRVTRYRYLVLAMLVVYCLGVGMFSGDLDDNRMLWLWIGVSLAVCRMIRLEQHQRFIRRITPAEVVKRVYPRPELAYPWPVMEPEARPWSSVKLAARHWPSMKIGSPPY